MVPGVPPLTESGLRFAVAMAPTLILLPLGMLASSRCYTPRRLGNPLEESIGIAKAVFFSFLTPRGVGLLHRHPLSREFLVNFLCVGQGCSLPLAREMRSGYEVVGCIARDSNALAQGGKPAPTLGSVSDSVMVTDGARPWPTSAGSGSTCARWAASRSSTSQVHVPRGPLVAQARLQLSRQLVPHRRPDRHAADRSGRPWQARGVLRRVALTPVDVGGSRPPSPSPSTGSTIAGSTVSPRPFRSRNPS